MPGLVFMKVEGPVRKLGLGWEETAEIIKLRPASHKTVVPGWSLASSSPCLWLEASRDEGLAAPHKKSKDAAVTFSQPRTPQQHSRCGPCTPTAK